MSILNFSDIQYSESIVDSSAKTQLGSFTNSATARQVKYVRVLMFFDGAFTNESMKLYITDDLTSPTFTHESDSRLVTSVDSSLSGDTSWFGWVRFDFNKEWLAASATRYLYMGASNYTETNTKSINIIYDYPVPVNGTRQTDFEDHAKAFQIFSYERT